MVWAGRWMRRTLAVHSKSFCSSSDVPVRSGSGLEDRVLEPWQNCSKNGSDFLSQASDKTHPLIQGISKLLQTEPGNPKFSSAQAQKLHLKSNCTAAMSFQRLKKRRWKQASDMKPTQYLFLMSQWIKKGGAMIGQPMFEQMLKVGVPPLDAYTTMIRHFMSRARSVSSSLDMEQAEREEELEKCVLESLKYLHEMREKGISPSGDSYEPLVTWFLENSKIAEFEEILEWIKDDGLTCYTGLFKSFGTLNRHTDAEDYFSLVKGKGVSDELMSEYLSAYVQGLVCNGKVDESVKMFRSMVQKFKVTPASIAYTLLINLACKAGQLHQALDLIQEMHEKRVRLTSEAFQPLMIALVHHSQPQGVFELFEAMKRMGVQPSHEVYTHVIRAYAKTSDVEKMFSLLNEMKELSLQRTTETYNAVIQALGSKRLFNRALAVLKDMENDNVKPDAGTMLELIYASPDSKTALEVFKQLRIFGVKPTDVVYSFLFSSMMKDGNLDKAIEMLKDPEASFRIGNNSKSTLLVGLAEGNRLEEAMLCFEDISRDGKFPDPFAFGSLIRAIGISGQLDRMLELIDSYTIDRMPKRIDRSYKEQRIRWFMFAIKACIIHNELSRLEGFLNKVEELDVSIVFDSIILDIANGEDKTSELPWTWADGFALLDVMQKLKVSPSRIFLETLLDGCVAAKDADRADRIIERMEKESLHLNGFSLVRLFRVYVVAEKAEKAASVLQRMKRSLKDEDIFLLAGQILNVADPCFQREVFKLLELTPT